MRFLLNGGCTRVFGAAQNYFSPCLNEFEESQIYTQDYDLYFFYFNSKKH